MARQTWGSTAKPVYLYDPAGGHARAFTVDVPEYATVKLRNRRYNFEELLENMETKLSGLLNSNELEGIRDELRLKFRKLFKHVKQTGDLWKTYLKHVENPQIYPADFVLREHPREPPGGALVELAELLRAMRTDVDELSNESAPDENTEARKRYQFGLEKLTDKIKELQKVVDHESYRGAHCSGFLPIVHYLIQKFYVLNVTIFLIPAELERIQRYDLAHSEKDEILRSQEQHSYFIFLALTFLPSVLFMLMLAYQHWGKLCCSRELYDRLKYYWNSSIGRIIVFTIMPLLKIAVSTSMIVWGFKMDTYWIRVVFESLVFLAYFKVEYLKCKCHFQKVF